MHNHNLTHICLTITNFLGKDIQGKTRSIVERFTSANQLNEVSKLGNRLMSVSYYDQRRIPPEVKERKNFAK